MFQFFYTKDVYANYMVLFKKEYVSHKEARNWAKFISDKYQEKYSDPLFLKYGNFDDSTSYQNLFVVHEKGVSLAKDVKFKDLREKICAYTKTEVLMTMAETVDEYKKHYKQLMQEKRSKLEQEAEYLKR